MVTPSTNGNHLEPSPITWEQVTDIISTYKAKADRFDAMMEAMQGDHTHASSDCQDYDWLLGKVTTFFRQFLGDPIIRCISADPENITPEEIDPLFRECMENFEASLTNAIRLRQQIAKKGNDNITSEDFQGVA